MAFNAVLRSLLCVLGCTLVSSAWVTPWDALSVSLKSSARNWFIKRATDKGIDWNGKLRFYQSELDTLKETSNGLQDDAIDYPKYYTRPFHGYDEGNLNWLAACELEASTESMSSGYFTDVEPKAGAARMRQTFATNIEDYAAQQGARPLRTLLDMGCSMGVSTEEGLARIGAVESAVGVDLSPHFLSIAAYNAERRGLPIKYMHANIDSLHLPESADVVTICFVFHELPPDAIRDTIAAAYRALRPGGVVAVLDLDPKKLVTSLTGWRKWGFEATEPHIFTYYGQKVDKLLEAQGFSAVDARENDPYNLGWFGVKPITEFGI